MSASIFNGLNPQQKEAVSHATGPSIILAGAGSGKTRVLVYKVINLIKNHHVLPSSVVMITFTNKAAAEMRQRIEKQIPKGERLGFIGTFHSFCARLLRIDGEKIGIDQNYNIFDESDQLHLIKIIIKEKDISKFTPSYYLNRISACKNQMIAPGRFLEIFSDYAAHETFAVYKEYQKQLKENKALDFDDLLIKGIELLTFDKTILEKYQNKYRFFLVDEFQDTNLVQYQLTKLLADKYKNITVVGDFSQSIYSWRGADIGNLEKLQKDFPNCKVFHLETNYRSTQTILDFAYTIITKNRTHPVLHLTTKNDKGEEIIFLEVDNEQDEVIFVAGEIQKLSLSHDPSQIAVLYRTNAQSRIIEEAFLHYGISYILIGGTRFYERKEIKDTLAYLRLLTNPEERVAKERLQKLGKTRWKNFQEAHQQLTESKDKFTTEELMEKIFQATKYLELYNPKDEEDYSRLENIRELKSVAIRFPNLTDFLEQVALVESEYFEDEKKHGKKDGVRLMTLHQAKGLEFDCVFIVGVEEGILPHSRSSDDHFQIEEERRLFYVGITRTREKLYITNARKRFIFGRRNYALKSRFLMDDDFVQFG